MEITVSSRHTEMSEALRAAAIEKIGRLTRFLEGMDRAEVHFSEERNPRIADKEVCEVTLEGHGHHVRCKVAAPDGFAAVDRAVEKLEHQLHKLKTKLVRRNRSPPAASRRAAGASPSPRPTSNERRRRDAHREDEAFTIKPMTPEEAVLQMELLGHGFFFFTNSETDRAAVVYRRADGDVGLIDQA